MKQHPLLGTLITPEVPHLIDAVGAVWHQHERFDGAGYPDGLAGDKIPLLVRVLAISGVYSAMTSDRPYRKALSREDALAELRRVSGSQLDPVVVEAFMDTLREEERAKEAV